MALVIGHNDQEIRLLTGLTQGERYQAQMKNSDDEQSHRGDWFDVDEIAISPPTKRIMHIGRVAAEKTLSFSHSPTTSYLRTMITEGAEVLRLDFKSGSA